MYIDMLSRRTQRFEMNFMVWIRIHSQSICKRDIQRWFQWVNSEFTFADMYQFAVPVHFSIRISHFPCRIFSTKLPIIAPTLQFFCSWGSSSSFWTPKLTAISYLSWKSYQLDKKRHLNSKIRNERFSWIYEWFQVCAPRIQLKWNVGSETALEAIDSIFRQRWTFTDKSSNSILFCDSSMFPLYEAFESPITR